MFKHGTSYIDTILNYRLIQKLKLIGEDEFIIDTYIKL